MKRKLLAMLLLGCLVFTACGSKDIDETSETAGTADAADTNSDTSAAQDTDTGAEEEIPGVEVTVEEAGIDAFVTVGEYKGLSFEKPIYNVTEEDIDNEIEIQLTAVPVLVTDPEATVVMGDTVNLDYSGSVDGVVFDGGTAEDQELLIGSGTFIDGFEEQLVGMKTGESGEIEVTFPDDYRKTELAGAEAVFAITINAIERPCESVTEEWLLENTEYTTEAEYRDAVKASLEAYYADQSEAALDTLAWDTIMETAEFIQFPKDMLQACYDQEIFYLNRAAASYGMDGESYLAATGTTLDDLMINAQKNLKSELVLEYICIKEGMEKGSQIYQEKESEILAMNGLSDAEAAIEAGLTTEWYVNFIVKYNLVMDFIVENSEITEITVEK